MISITNSPQARSLSPAAGNWSLYLLLDHLARCISSGNQGQHNLGGDTEREGRGKQRTQNTCGRNKPICGLWELHRHSHPTCLLLSFRLTVNQLLSHRSPWGEKQIRANGVQKPSLTVSKSTYHSYYLALQPNTAPTGQEQTMASTEGVSNIGMVVLG